jgi:transposase
LNSTPEEDTSKCHPIYSLIETAKANKPDPYWYLRYLFENLPDAMTAEEFKALLLMHVDKYKLNIPEYK